MKAAGTYRIAIKKENGELSSESVPFFHRATYRGVEYCVSRNTKWQSAWTPVHYASGYIIGHLANTIKEAAIEAEKGIDRFIGEQGEEWAREKLASAPVLNPR